MASEKNGKTHVPAPPEPLDPDAPPSAEELLESDRLREALADPTKANVDADFARALALSHAPRELDEHAHRAIIDRAISKRERAPSRQGRGVVVRVAFGAAAALALAAGVMFVVRAPQGIAAPAALALTRSTQPLFVEQFPKSGGESDRIDRIAMARSGDLRENRFARWGVR